jgi:hypothetical protein
MGWAFTDVRRGRKSLVKKVYRPIVLVKKCRPSVKTNELLREGRPNTVRRRSLFGQDFFGSFFHRLEKMNNTIIYGSDQKE